jgi:hypothetical protein
MARPSCEFTHERVPVLDQLSDHSLGNPHEMTVTGTS